MRDRPNEILGDVQKSVIDTIESKFSRDSAVFVAEVLEYDSSTKEATCLFPDGTTRQARVSGQDGRISKFMSTKVRPAITNESTDVVGTDEVLIINAGYPSHTLEKTLAIHMESKTLPPKTAADLSTQLLIDQLSNRDNSETLSEIDAEVERRREELRRRTSGSRAHDYRRVERELFPGGQ